MNMAVTMAGSYNHWLVAFSLVIAIATSYTALDLARRVTANHGTARIAWLLGGAFAMGSGIWCMHYIGMLAFRLPVPVYYHLPTVALSLFAAIAASVVALYVVSRGRLTAANALAGSGLMGAGIATMHYTGMAAMRSEAMHHYTASIVILSIVLAILISFAGLLLIFSSRNGQNDGGRNALTALALGLAIPVMHYTGMAATTFSRMPTLPSLANSVDISNLAVITILVVTLVILGFALVTGVVDRRLSAQQETLDREREILRALIDNVPDFMFVKDTHGRFVLANPQTCRAVGAGSPQELIGHTLFEFFPFAIADAIALDEQRMLRSGVGLFNHEETIVDVKGNRIAVLMTKVPLHDGEGRITGIAAVGCDITERKKIEVALREAEQKYRRMFDEALVGIFRLDAEGRVADANPAMASYLGYASPRDLLQCFTEPLWLKAVSNTRRAEFMELMQQQGFVRAFEVEVFRKDHSKIWITTSVRALTNKGEVNGYEGMFEDITERKLLREQLLQAQKLESVGQLAAGIAHEINTPTQYIGDNVRFLQDAFKDLTNLTEMYRGIFASARTGTLSVAVIEQAVAAEGRANLVYLLQEIPEAIEQTLEGVTRVSTLVGAMKEFSHPGTKEKVPLDLNHAIQSTITVARNEWKYVAEMDLDLDPTLPLVACQPGEFNQVILNIIVNAAHAIAAKLGDSGERGRIRVSTRNTPTAAEIRITDTGIGIPADVQPRIFDPFFTTKDIGKGTGQGLAIARSVIVDKHAGALDFETMVGRGTTFILRLPHAPAGGAHASNSGIGTAAGVALVN